MSSTVLSRSISCFIASFLIVICLLIVSSPPAFGQWPHAGGHGGCNGFSCRNPCYYCGPQRPAYRPPASPSGQQGQSTSTATTSGGTATCTATCRALASCAGWTGGNQGFGGSRGVFYDVNVGDAAANIKNEETACRVFIEQYVDGPVPANKLIETIAEKFYKPEKGDSAQAKSEKKTENGLKPSTFHCCHTQFAKKFFPNSTQNYPVPQLPDDVTCASLVKKLFVELTKKE